jgi:hypothetical protein
MTVSTMMIVYRWRGEEAQEISSDLPASNRKRKDAYIHFEKEIFSNSYLARFVVGKLENWLSFNPIAVVV